MTECIHGLDLELCDICSPKKAPEKVAVKRVAAVRTTRPTPLKAKAARRLHVVLSLDDLADALASGALTDPIYFVGPEELAWAERRRAADATQQVVLVVASSAVAGLDEMPLAAVELVAVASNAVQQRVRELLALTDLAPRVAVYPPWFVAE
jgi:hypothetical protein